MPRRIANDGPSLLSGERENVLIDIDGRARLASRNKFPNGDLDDDGPAENTLDQWPDLEAPPQNASWFPYYSDRAGTRFWRQTFEGVDLGDGEWTLDDPWVKIAAAPDVTDQGRVAAPRRFAVDLAPLDAIGFGAGDYWLALNYGVGSWRLPRHLLRWTEPTDWLQVNIPEDGMGLDVFLPERPEGVSFYSISLSRRNQGPDTGRQQRVTGVAYGVRDFVRLRGPWKNGHRPPEENRTYIGALGQIPPPIVALGSRVIVRSGGRRRVYRAQGGTQGGWFQFRVLAKTEFGWTLPGEQSRQFWAGNGWLSCAYWVKARPIPGVKIESVAIEVRGRKIDSPTWSDWQRLGTSHGETEWSFNRFVPVYGWTASELPNPYTLESSQAGGEDASGIPNPETALEAPRITSGAPIGPGRKFVKATWGYHEEDEVGRVEERESAPSPMITVDVPGVAGAATHTIKYHRPPGMNEERNPRFVNLRRDGREEDWVREPEGATGAVFGPALGYSEVTDATNATTNQAVYYSAPVPLDEASPEKAIRMTVDLPEEDYVGGRVSVQLQFLAADGSVNKTQIVGVAKEPGREYVHLTIGPQGTNTDVRYGPQTAHYRRRFVHVGASVSGPRNFRAIYKDVGAYPGLAHPLKRFGVIEGSTEDTDAEDFPPNAYISVLSRELVDEERIRPRQNLSPWVREVIDFDDGVPPDVGMLGAPPTLFAERPVSGEQSLLCAPGAALQSAARIDLGAGRASASCLCKLRPEFMPLEATGDHRLAEVSDAAGPVAFVETTPEGDLQLRTSDNAGTVLTNTITDFGLDDALDLDLEIAVEGIGTNNAEARYYAARGGGARRLIGSHGGVDLSGREARFFSGGVVAGAANSGVRIALDEIEVFERDEWEDVAGRIVEYWAADGTPKHAKNGMGGARVPVEAGKSEILSVFCEYRGWREVGGLLGYAVRNVRGEVIERHAPLVSGRGLRRMRRYWRAHVWPEDAAYVEFDSNDLGAGLVRWAAYQLEGMTPDGRPTPFTNEHVSDGWVEVPFHTRVPGVPKGSALDVYNRITAFRTGEARGDTPEGTSITASFSTSGDAGEAWSEYSEDLPSMEVAERVKARAHLHTDDLEATPELTEIVVDFTRAGPVVCLSDGTEIPGGAVPLDFPAVQEGPNVQPEEYADGLRGFTAYGERPLVANGWKIEAYFDEGVMALSKQIGRDDSCLVVEELGQRHHCQVLNLPIPPPDRLVNYLVKGREHGGFQFVSDAVDSGVLSVEPL